jgi:hypothetical protein
MFFGIDVVGGCCRGGGGVKLRVEVAKREAKRGGGSALWAATRPTFWRLMLMKI